MTLVCQQAYSSLMPQSRPQVHHEAFWNCPKQVLSLLLITEPYKFAPLFGAYSTDAQLSVSPTP